MIEVFSSVDGRSLFRIGRATKRVELSPEEVRSLLIRLSEGALGSIFSITYARTGRTIKSRDAVGGAIKRKLHANRSDVHHAGVGIGKVGDHRLEGARVAVARRTSPVSVDLLTALGLEHSRLTDSSSSSSDVGE